MQMSLAQGVFGAQKMAANFRFTRIEDGRKLRSEVLGEIVGDPTGQSWLFVSPHDDDLAIGAGLLMQAAKQAGVEVRVLVVTDGCLGYCTLQQRDSIVRIRRAETIESFRVLGIEADSIFYIDYPDGGLTPFIGRRPARPGERDIAGYVGLQNAFTYHLRRFRPARVFVPTPTDLHPDHRITHSELMISLFHAGGAIWPELGEPLDDVPRVGELAVYCDFLSAPDWEIRGGDEAFERKLRSIEAYRSQAQIAALVANVRAAGPYEYVRDVQFRLYSADAWRKMFA
jgi:LmbE family N-acetylglucosaminyl deacetylase